MQSQEVVAILRAKGVDATLEDLPSCPGSHLTPFACVTLPNGDLLSMGRDDGEWTTPDEDLGDRLHMQTMPGQDYAGCFEPDWDYDSQRIWTDVNLRDALSIAETFGRSLMAHDGYVSCTPEGCVIR